MSAINNANNRILQSQIANIQLQNDISVGVLKKAQNTAKQQGQALVQLIDSAKNIANPQSPSLGAQASGLGQNFDITG